jgi:hypothetical protein
LVSPVVDIEPGKVESVVVAAVAAERNNCWVVDLVAILLGGLRLEDMLSMGFDRPELLDIARNIVAGQLAQPHTAEDDTLAVERRRCTPAAVVAAVVAAADRPQQLVAN